MTYDQTVFDLAAEYVDCLHTMPNGWGQQIHPRFGQSHYVLRYMSNKFGTSATQEAIRLEFKHRREQDDQATTVEGFEAIPAEPAGDSGVAKDTPVSKAEGPAGDKADELLSEGEGAQYRTRH